MHIEKIVINAVTVKMTTNYLVSVPKLKGRENYCEWAFAAENFLVLEGMSESIKSKTIPAEIGAAGDAKTRAKLILTIDSSLYVHIKGVQTTYELWKKLKNLFDDSGFTRRISLLRSLISVRLENSVSMTSYVTQIIETSQKLSGTGFNINDEWVASLLLAGLTEKYSPMIMAIEHCGIPLTADAIKTKLLDMEESGNEGDNGAINSGGAFASFKKNRNVGNTAATKDSTQMSKSKPKVITCYKCKQTGHYRNQCTFINKNSSNVNKNERTSSNAFSAVFLNGEFCKSDWYIDSGASVHLTANEEWLSNVSRELMIKEIVVANKDKVPVLCTGDVQITTKTHACEYDITVEGVLCVPKLTTNLLSVSQLISKGNKVSFNKYGCQIFNIKGVLVATANLLNGVYKLNMPPDCSSAAVMVSSEVWHRRLGHVNSQYLNKMQDAVQGLTLDNKTDISKSSCVACCEGKQSRLPFPKESSRSTELLNIVHTDLCGPMENRSIGGSKYFMLFIDDFSRMTYIYFLKSKDEALKCFQQYKAEVENQLNSSIKILRSDNGKEFCNSKFDEFLMSHGIIHHKTNPYTPEQNGVSERYNRSIVEKAKCLLFDAGLEKRFWAEAAHTAVYLLNRTVTTTLNYKTPFEMWTGRRPDVSHLRVFGSTIMVHVPKQKRLKWDRKSEKCILVGYSNDVKGYRIYNPKSNVITTSRDVIVLEKIETENVLNVQENCSDEVNMVPVGDDSILQENSLEQSNSLNTDDSGEVYEPCENDTLDSSENGTTDIEDSITLDNANIISGPRHRRQPDRYGFLGAHIEDDNLFTDEISLQEALEGPEKAQWLAAVQDELESFEKNSAWELVDVPINGTIVQCKWVLRKKYDIENQVRYRARLVAKGFTQKHGVDYTETFSPVVRHTTLRLLFALSVKLGLEVNHLDVKTAFLNGDLEETIYMKMPDCYYSNSLVSKVLKLKKAIYGLKQASRAWNKKVDDCLISNGYKRSKIEPCMYIKDINKCKTIVTVYVDDFFIFSNDKIETNNLKQMLSNKFSIKDLGEVKLCLGMNVKFNKDKGYVTLSQETYIDQLLSKFNLNDCKTVDTPMEVKLNISKAEAGLNNHLPYQQLIGSLMYLSVLTRPDISYSISFLSQFNNCHANEHWEYAKRVLKYLKQTKSYGIKYCKEGNSEITGYVDADWASNSVDRRSYTGMCFLLSNGAISWECKKQKCIALSSTESEYISLSEACKEALYLKALQYEITNKMYTISLYNDNQGAQKLCANPVFHKRTKHIDIKYHFCRDLVKDQIVKILYLPTADMPADILTKSLCSTKHYKFMSLLGIVCVE